jgi:Fe-S-cluster containining protein
LNQSFPSLLKEELAELYLELAAEQRSLTAACHQCGDCCNFVQYDHQLWVTDLELAYLIETEGYRPTTHPGRCPYMQGNQCTARSGRTLGCRIFLCTQNAVEMQVLHEKYFNRLQTLARKHDMELTYDEFLESLKKAGPETQR